MTERAFSADWLAMREAADHRARDAGLIDRLCEWMTRTGARRVLDLGCGSGATLRALAPRLPDDLIWTLVDHDDALLRAARARLLNWADAAAEDGPAMALVKGARKISLRLERCDLSADILPDLIEKTEAEVVTASAFFDLAGAEFIDALAAAAKDADAAVYAALTYDGREVWTPPHPAERDAIAAFHAHMRSDKGLGAAMGPDAAKTLERALKNQGLRTLCAPSNWRLSAPRDSALIRELACGSVLAVGEALAAPDWLDDWADARSHATRVEIGHADILALPPD